MSITSLPSDEVFNPVVGVVGGGQLAQMLAKAAINRGVDLVVQSSSKSDPAVPHAKEHLLADPRDFKATSNLLEKCTCVTFENEWIDIEGLKSIDTRNRRFHPSLSSLSPLVDKISQRQLLSQMSIPCTEWLPLKSLPQLDVDLPTGWNYPIVAKAGRGGYDGKGTRVISNSSELSSLYTSVDLTNWFIEKWESYEVELAIVASRDREGTIRAFPLVETCQINQICSWVLAPASVNHDVQAMAYNVVSSLLTKLNYVGVMAVEFFYGVDGLKVNEIAPRTHNSAHYSIDACNSSQFDQQLCIAAGLPVPNPKLIAPGALMVNLLGLNQASITDLAERIKSLKEIESANFHWYEKHDELPGRKLGHMTFLLSALDPTHRKSESLRIIEQIRSIWPIN